MREIRRVMSEISSLNSRILTHVYRRAWDRDLLREMQTQLEGKKRELERLRTVAPRTQTAGSLSAGPLTADDGEDTVTVHDTRLIANALFTQRPLIYESDEWLSYRRVCAALVRLFAHEIDDETFDSTEFLRHCGLSLKDAEEISRRPGDYIRRSEELFGKE